MTAGTRRKAYWRCCGKIEAHANAQLTLEPFTYGFTLRSYQIDAIRAVEAGIAAGRRALLLAMATGTGKTKTCIALIYRLLKTQRFRRVLFLVDHSALGQQAANAFKDTRMESLQSFADIFGMKELDEAIPETATAVHIATVQGMVRRVLNATDDQPPPAVDQYDCIIVDEQQHRMNSTPAPAKAALKAHWGATRLQRVSPSRRWVQPLLCLPHSEPAGPYMDNAL